MLEFGTNPQKWQDVQICTYAMCKNESHFVDRWLESVWNKGKGSDYITVLDTGSSDDTLEHLIRKGQELGIPEGHLIVDRKIISPWRFDVARNESMTLIPDCHLIDACFCLDLDETVDARFWVDYRKMVFQHPNFSHIHYYYVWRHSDDGKPVWWFWYDKTHGPVGWEWEFPVHETLVCRRPELYDGQTYYLNQNILYVHHFPDSGKGRNYLPLLEVRAQEHPTDVVSAYYLAREYSFNYMWDKCKDACKRTLDIMDDAYIAWDPELHNTVLSLYAESFEKLGLKAEAEYWYKEAINAHPQYRRPYIPLAQMLAYEGRPEECLEVVEQMNQKSQKLHSWRTPGWINAEWKEVQIVADAYSWQGRYDEAYDMMEHVRERLSEDDKVDAERFGFFADYEFMKARRTQPVQEEPRLKTLNCSWVTLLFNNEYFRGEVATVKSIQDSGTKYPIACLVTPNVREDYKLTLKDMGVNLISVPFFFNKTHEDFIKYHPKVQEIRKQQIHWTDSLAKLNILNLTQFDKIVYIDNDVQVLKNMDDLFEYPHMSACKDMCGTANQMCAGMLVIEPSAEEFEDVIDYMTFRLGQLKDDELFSDQNVFREKYTSWNSRPEKCIPSTYNYWFNFAQLLPEGADVRSLHFVLEKPWAVPLSFYDKYKESDPKAYKMMMDYVAYLDKCTKEVVDKYGHIHDFTPLIHDPNQEIEFSVVIPYHYEPQTVVNYLLTSIDGQVGYDFSKMEILICTNDGGDNRFDVSLYPNIKDKIRFISEKYELSGPGESKHLGLKYARGKYITFYDCDDSLTAFDIYHKAFGEIHNLEKSNVKFDAVAYNYIDEIYQQLTYQVYNLKTVMPWVQWAYIYRRGFFVENNLQFNTKIAISEDVYFNQACMLSNIQVYKSELSMYIHRMLADSTGNINLYTTSRLNDTFIIASDLLDRYGVNNSYAHRLGTGCLVEAFNSVYAHTNGFNDFGEETKNELVQRLIDFFDKYDPTLQFIDGIDLATPSEIAFTKSIYQLRRLPD